MKSSEVLNVLGISRPTLTKYVKEGTIKATKMYNNRYDYDTESVYTFLNKDFPRLTILYCGVPFEERLIELKQQKKKVKFYCWENGIIPDKVVEEFQKKDNIIDNKFWSIIFKDYILQFRVKTLIIINKEVLFGYLQEPRLFNIIKFIFSLYGCEIITIMDE